MSHAAEQIRFCESRDGTRIAYAVCGAGSPIVLAPHWVHHVKLAWDSPIWRPWLELLSRRHSLVRYDCRGCGLSDRDGVEFSHHKHVEDLEAVVAAAGSRRFAFVGYGSGGTTGVGYTVRHPETVSRLILIGAPVRGRHVRAASRSDVEEAQTRLKVFEIGWSNDIRAYGEFIAALHMPDASAAQAHSYSELLRQTTSQANALALLRSYWEDDVHDIVPRIRCPTLVLHARQDGLIPFEQGRLFASLIPGARFVPLETRNHVLLDKEPAWQQLVAALDDFLPSAGVIERLLDELTARENEVLELIAQGLDNETIARRLGSSPKTVRNQASIIFSKLDVNSRAQAIVRAREAGFGRNLAPKAG